MEIQSAGLLKEPSCPFGRAGDGDRGDTGADERGWLGGSAGLSREEQFHFLTAKEGCGEIGLSPA